MSKKIILLISFVLLVGLVNGSACGYEDQNDYYIARSLPPTMDGVISPGEWEKAEWIYMTEVSTGTLPPDLSNAKWAALWSLEHNLLYVLVQGTDTDQVLSQFVDWNQQDDVEIYVDANNSDANEAAYYENTFRYAQHPFIGTDGTDDWVNLGRENADSFFPGGYAVDVQGDVITYEFALTPYADCNIVKVENSVIKKLQAGDLVGLDIDIASKWSTGYGRLSEHSSPYKWRMADVLLDQLLVNARDTLVAHVESPWKYRKEISPNKTLWWMAGDYGDHHDIFFGDNYNDVLNATISSVPAGVFYTRQDSNSIERTVYNASGELAMGQKYYWRVDEISDTVAPYEWTGDVWEFSVDSGKTKYPDPADKARNLTPGDILLSWTKGLKAVSNDVYFGDNYAAVNNADTGTAGIFIGNRTDCNIGRLDYSSETLTMGKTYYWRIDAVNDLDGRSPWKGDVWRFSIADYLTIDDFESYADMAALKDVWGDNGLVLPDLCTTLPVLNVQSMFMQCYNFGPGYDAEVTKTFAAEQDWSETSAAGVKAVGLSYFGKASNPGDHLYIKLEDGTGKVAKMAMTDSDSLQKEHWQQINYALADFTSPEVIDLGRIKKLTIGTGHGVYMGVNKINIDNVRIYVSRCVPQYGPAGDVTGDCFSDMRDIKNLALDWGITSWSVEVEDPCLPPVLHYPFDGDACDVSDNGYNGSVVDSGQPTWGTDRFGVYGKVLTFDGYSTYVDVPVDLFAGISEEITVSLWHYGDVWTAINSPVTKTHRHLFFADEPAFHPNDPNDTWQWRELNLYFQNNTNTVHVSIGNNANDVNPPGTSGYGLDSISKLPNIDDVQQRWNHWAVTKDANSRELNVYLNGCLWNSKVDAGRNISDVGMFRIGAEIATKPANEGGGLKGLVTGRMDDFRIYDYALTHGEICSLADMTPGTIYQQPIETLLKSTGLSTDVHADWTINFKDFSAMAATWLQEQLWP